LTEDEQPAEKRDNVTSKDSFYWERFFKHYGGSPLERIKDHPENDRGSEHPDADEEHSTPREQIQHSTRTNDDPA
jgi:hypothetical protein